MKNIMVSFRYSNQYKNNKKLIICISDELIPYNKKLLVLSNKFNIKNHVNVHLISEHFLVKVVKMFNYYKIIHHNN